MLRRALVAVALAFSALLCHAAITIGTSGGVVSTIVGDGISPFDVRVTSDLGTGQGVATFSQASASVGFSDGAVLSTGNMGCVRSGNTQTSCTSPSIGALGTRSSVSFKFKVEQAGTLSFVYVFASEEYGDSHPQNDAASFVLTGPGGTVDLAKAMPASVTTVGCDKNPTQFIDNHGTKCADSGLTRDIEFNGLTIPITVTARLEPGTYTFEFSVSDAGEGFGGPDAQVDSALFIKARSFSFTANAGETVTYYHNDAAGSPLLATDVQGNVLWHESYKPYGDRATPLTTATENKLFFHGRSYDSAVGLSYFGARYYDAIIGRFMGPDPVAFREESVQSFNRYVFAANNPYKFTDPDGRAEKLIPDEMGGAGRTARGLGADILGRRGIDGGPVRMSLETQRADMAAARGTWNPPQQGNYVYRGLAKGENPAAGISARAPGAGNSPLSHVAGKRDTQWISTTKDLNTAIEKYGQNGVVRIDLNKVGSEVKDVSGGIANGGRMSNWARRDQEVLIRDHIPAGAIERIR
jgi:RHS repeat-associated protein